MKNFMLCTSAALMLLFGAFAILMGPMLSQTRAIPPDNYLLEKMSGTGGNATVTTIHSRYYTFEPKDDITAPELAKALRAMLPGLACHNAMSCPDILQSIDDLPESTKRHFVLHE